MTSPKTTFEAKASHPGRDDRGGAADGSSELISVAVQNCESVRRQYVLRPFDYRAVELVRRATDTLLAMVNPAPWIQPVDDESVIALWEAFYPPGGRNRNGPG